MTTKRAKKRFQSNVNVIEFQQFQHTHQTNLPQKKQRVTVVPRNPNQEEYLQKLHDQTKNIVFAIGPAGTGKTLLACQVGIKLFKEGLVDKIVITRPAVSVAAHTKIGDFVSINRNCSVGHHTILKDFVTLNPGVNIGGNVVIGESTIIGLGTSIFNGVTIGKNTVIGAGSVVTKDIPDDVVAWGNPCKIIRKNEA